MKRKKQPRMRDPNFDDDHCKRLKDYELKACTWNVRTLNWEGASAQLVDVLVRVKADIPAIQEMRWTGHGRKKMGPCDIYYSGHIKERKFGVGFVVGERLRRRVLAFTPVDERLKAKFFNISLICAHVIKDTFYERLERTYERCPRHDVKIVLGDFNARLGKEGVFGPTVGKFSLHDETSPNGLRLIDFAGTRNMTRFQYKKIHQATWLSPDRITRNQIDHVVIDGRHVSSVFDVRTLRGPNIDSDHYLVAAKIRTRLCVEKRTRQQTQGRFDFEKLQSLLLSESRGDLVIDDQSILSLWREHFSSLLNGSESTTPGDGEPDSPIDDDGADVPLPDREEIRIAITRLKNNKAAGADGLPAGLFKYGGEELIRCLHQLLCRIWSEESMPDDWNLSVLCPIHKKGDPTICANYRGISLLNIAYKVLSSVLCERLKPTVNKLIGPYQCGFRPGKSTTDQIFTMRQILEKTHENRIDSHHLFVDFSSKFNQTVLGRQITGSCRQQYIRKHMYPTYLRITPIRIFILISDIKCYI
ncbi:uncharacterized protein LOC105219245 isoform X1 [Zeugodacus cucurbitae]|uniref:uncharacterized protein LOC105219245 isoform X1 n=1 Tax=Zeugodacus cucurbitae TaxID=28588 RepID=UPI0023D9031A|nr:uncharacterized protein LOC105219245 isoform X1 [Zeugodacus cucurbitae]XP_054082673.1 uncharacterized protein LOC105219245 isoform X1 [Zeugodacus cucurbitae]XP_054082674.1 uncharacterized protein LOC105219245 isoform X1 [Zeugodacus cucurbitae]